MNDFDHPEDFKRREEYMARCRLMRKWRAAENIAKILKNTWEGGPVTVTRQPGVKSGIYQFGFKALKQQIFIPFHLAKDLGLDVTRKVNVVYDLSDGEPHHTPYARKARFKDPSRRLGIQLKGNYGRGPNKGLAFEKWLQCGSVQAISTANSILGLIQKPAGSGV